MKAACVAALLPLSAAVVSAETDTPPQTELAIADSAGFSAIIGGVETSLPIITATVMPGESLRIDSKAEIEINQGTLKKTPIGAAWVAPMEPGVHQITLHEGGESIRINAIVLTPFENGVQTSLNGYRVGKYTKKLYRGLAKYEEPRGFIDLSLASKDLQVSPHFKLGQFICKQQPGHDPTYLLLQPDLLVKLEVLLAASNAKGWEADTFFVMSGFRTPFYNAAIGNKTTSSRHLYGDGADIYIDHDRDGVMDDLNGDGKITKDDARTLGKLAESLAEKGGPDWPAGGVGIYGSNAVHGPFVHIDARGYPARW